MYVIICLIEVHAFHSRFNSNMENMKLLFIVSNKVAKCFRLEGNQIDTNIAVENCN